MFTIVETVEILRPRSEVFAFFTDPGRRPEWDLSVVSEQLLTPPPVGEGSRIRTRMQVMGRELEFEWQVTVYDAPAVMAATSETGSMPTRLSFALDESTDGCTVTATIEGQPAGMLRLLEPVVSETARKTLATGLARAKSLLESGA